MVKERTDIAMERRALRLVEDLLDVPIGDRRSLIDTRCGGDRPLADRVERLLAATTTGEFARDEALPHLSAFLPGAEEDFVPGGRVGAYELVRPIGRGGMGWVFEAIQENPRRQVAVKMLRFGLDSAEARRRFELESEILARLKHPAIAQVFEAGVHRVEGALGSHDLPYLALEFIEGARTITEFVEQEGLGRRALLELFLEVCEAVHHGHQKGVIHRDLKPGNILVASTGRPKVIDYGVARVRDGHGNLGSDETRDGQLVGTPGTMSPEQLSGGQGAVDTRSDVYSLGVILYELLCGRRPHDVEGKSVVEVARIVCHEEPARPRRFVPDLEPDLEAVLLKALAREREQRYESVARLVEDLRHFLRHEPVAARRSTAPRRAFLFVRRNPLLAGAGTAIALTLAIATVVSARYAWLAGQAVEAKELEVVAANRARAAEADALRHSLELRDDLLAFSEGLTVELVRRLEEAGATVELRKEVVAFTIAELENMHERSRGDVAALASLARCYTSLGDSLGNPTQSNLGDIAGAEHAYDRAQEIGAEIRATGTEGSIHAAGRVDVEVLQRRGDLAQAAGDFVGAVERYLSARSLLEELVLDQPEDAALLEGLMICHDWLGTIRGGVDQDFEAALHEFEGGLEVLERLRRLQPERADLVQKLDVLLSKRATVLTLLGRHEEALVAMRASLRLAEEQSAANPKDVGKRHNLVQTLGMLANSELNAGDFEAAEASLQRAMSVDDEVRELGDPDVRKSSHFIYLMETRARCHLGWAQASDDENAATEHFELARELIDTCLFELEEHQASGSWTGRLEVVRNSARETDEAIASAGH